MNMPCRISDGPQQDCEFLDDLTEEEEQFVLADIDPDWHLHFTSSREAWNHYWDFNALEMEQAADELIRERTSPLLRVLRDIAEEQLAQEWAALASSQDRRGNGY